MLKKLFNILPESAKKQVKLLRYFIIYFGRKRRCPVCGKYSRKFRKTGIIPREDAQCAYCGALERHRFAWLYFYKKTNLFDKTSKTMLHIAPEECFISSLRKHLGQNYVTADLFNEADVIMDITDIQYPDEYFDIIYCSHVLEHVLDDKKAMKEFYRVLKQEGWAILVVPITAEKTFEDPTIVNPLERLEVFGQEDHVRRYGPDYVNRLRETGFKVEVNKVAEMFEKKDIITMGLTEASGEIYYCTKT